ncbi:MAG TPA: cytochrome c1 [Usitatibacter sp.]|nr:cytochrome c1 [Usitatibacter sp.]
MKKLLAILIAVPALAWASAGGGGTPLDRAPVNLHDKSSLQRGAQIFVNHCLNCHSASAMRYGRLEELGLTEAQIKENLLFTSEKIGDTMGTPMESAVGKAAFGVVPPDLSLIARSRSPDWLYTYMRSFYRDPASKTGWNNTVFPNVAMPHVLWEYQGDQALQVTERMDEKTGDMRQTRKLVVDRPGQLDRVAYDVYVGDLVNYLTYMGEPAKQDRKKWGILVLFFLAGFVVLALMLKTEYWKDVR